MCVRPDGAQPPVINFPPLHQPRRPPLAWVAGKKFRGGETSFKNGNTGPHEDAAEDNPERPAQGESWRAGFHRGFSFPSERIGQMVLAGDLTRKMQCEHGADIVHRLLDGLGYLPVLEAQVDLSGEC